MEVKEEYMKSQLNRFQKIAKKIELDKWLDTSIVSSDPPYTTFRTIKRGAHLKEGPLYQLPDSTLMNSQDQKLLTDLCLYYIDQKNHFMAEQLLNLIIYGNPHSQLVKGLFLKYVLGGAEI